MGNRVKNEGRCPAHAATLLIMITAAVAMTCGDDSGSGPTGYGAVAGTVWLPPDLTASQWPVEGAIVRLVSGDFDSSVSTNAEGAFLFEEVPNLRAKLSAAYGECFTVSNVSVTVIADQTVTQDLVLPAAVSGECLGLHLAGAARMELHSASNAAVLLYDTPTNPTPTLVAVDLASGEEMVRELSDLDNVYDLELISPDLGVLSYRSSAGFGLRFFDPATLSPDDPDVIYMPAPLSGTHEPGRLARGHQGQTVFVTHGTRLQQNVSGMVFAVSASGRALIDADDDPNDGAAAFDNDLVDGALAWAFNVAFDPDAGEILVANRQILIESPPTVTAIDWAQWGSFDRDGGLSTPTEGVRIVDMDPDVSGFGVEFWDFAAGRGVAAHQSTRILAYESGAEAFTPPPQTFDQIDLRSGDFVLRIVPERESWFAIVFDRVTGIKAVEEWTLSTLERHHRYANRFAVAPPLKPRAFAVDAASGKLYVAYENAPILEIIDLCTPGECVPPGR